MLQRDGRSMLGRVPCGVLLDWPHILLGPPENTNVERERQAGLTLPQKMVGPALQGEVAAHSDDKLFIRLLPLLLLLLLVRFLSILP